MSILGILPFAGSGSRLGMPFHKALSPTLTADGIQPLYAHSYDRLRRVADDIVFVLSEDGAADPCLLALPGRVLVKPERGELPSSLALAARTVPVDTLCAVALPDSVWWPADGMTRLVEEFHKYRAQPIDGVLGLFTASSHVLDAVSVGRDGFVSFVERHNAPPAPARDVRGWGCFVATAGVVRGLSDDRPLGPQLADYRFSAVRLDGPYLDLGTPDRYASNLDLRAR